MNKGKEIRSTGRLLTLHPAPGAALSIVYFLLVKAGILGGYPRYVIMGLAGALSIVPIELGYLLYTAKREASICLKFSA